MTTVLRIGLTGGIGSGKTTVARLFETRGVPLLDADRIARELTEPGRPALGTIRQAFGLRFFRTDGSLNRDLLRAAIFDDSPKRRRLEEILHPLIRSEIRHRIESIEAPYLIVVIPLLVETGNWEWLDEIIVVDLPEEVQIDRAMKRDRMTRARIQTILNAQAGRQERLAHADEIIDNRGEPERLPPQIEKLHKKYMNWSGSKPHYRS